ncbi:peptide deformylase [Woodsholea maritima]|uniref:peptide deformylase n=1 Tax=Woodsholea maritima TaxID=240237 RepID=UPI0003780CE7|nr:peptide deformylase [Woodsholea maritima]
MAIRDILTVPDPRLKLVSDPVDGVDDDLRALMDDMLETMYAADGIGLAAIQVGVAKRVIVMDLSGPEERAEPRYFVNPVITPLTEDVRPYQEGCLSIPDVYDEVERPAKVKLTYLDYEGEAREEIAEGMFATCIQHEMDHLEGIVFIDYLSRLKRERAVKKVQKLVKTRSDAA